MSRVVAGGWVKRRILRMCTAGLVGGKPQAEYLARLGLPADTIFQGYDAVDNEYFSRKAEEARAQNLEARKKYQLPPNYFLASARFVDKKNLFNLIRAYSLYRKLIRRTAGLGPHSNTHANGHSHSDSSAWSLVLLGDGPLKPDLCRLVQELDLQDSILLPGFKQYHELPSFYALAKVFVHASTVEQWGLVVNEAMACGLPVVVSNRCGCARDLVQENVNGFTFDPYEPAQIAELMFRISDAGFPLANSGAASARVIAESEPRPVWRWPEPCRPNLWCPFPGLNSIRSTGSLAHAVPGNNPGPPHEHRPCHFLAFPAGRGNPARHLGFGSGNPDARRHCFRPGIAGSDGPVTIAGSMACPLPLKK